MTLWEQCFLSRAAASVHRNCPNCGAVMRLVRIAPSPDEDSGADLLSFERECRHSRTEPRAAERRNQDRLSRAVGRRGLLGGKR